MAPTSSVVSNPLEPEVNLASQKPGDSPVHGVTEAGGDSEKSKGVIGVLDVYLHHARDLQNICIYHKQDVYAKILLTDDPEKTVLSQVINGGGRDPDFDESLQIDVRTIESSLKCEIWMLSRIKNYLKDQLLGFVLVPLTDVVIENGITEKQLSLTSDDMFHSPSGCVKLTLAYNGASPEVLEIPVLEIPSIHSSISQEFEMVEFPDPKIANENEMMVTEYYGIPIVDLDSEEDRKAVDNTIPGNNSHSEVDAPIPAVEINNITEVSKVQASLSSVSINGSPSGPVATSSNLKSSGNTNDAAKGVKHGAVDVAEASDLVNQDVVPLNENREVVGEANVNNVANPIVNLNIGVMGQDDYAEIYMKSMQQFTEALAKMKLPVEAGTSSAPTEKEKDESAKKDQNSKDNGKAPRVFYGSRAFF